MTISKLVDSNDTRLDPYLRLSERQLKQTLNPTSGRIILESPNVIEVALKLGLELESIFIDERHLDRLLKILGPTADNLEILTASRELMSSIVGFQVMRGWLAAAKRPAPRDIQAVVRGAQRIALLEGLTDVSNVGAVFRSAAALGVDAILVAPNCADPFNRRSIRVSMGAVLQLPWTQITSEWPRSIFNVLQEEHFHTVALALKKDALQLGDPQLVSYDRLALFFGSEGYGLSQEVLDGVDDTVIIPMSMGIDSLNVAASSAVSFWELCKRNRM